MVECVFRRAVAAAAASLLIPFAAVAVLVASDGGPGTVTANRLDVAPGLTGLWQISGRSDLSFEVMCLLDIYYTENWSLGMDISILLRTVPLVLFGRGAY